MRESSACLQCWLPTPVGIRCVPVAADLDVWRNVYRTGFDLPHVQSIYRLAWLYVWTIIECPSQPCKEFNFLEFYAGRARTTEAFRQAGEVSAKFDILYNDVSTRPHKSNFMDLTAASGFLLLVRTLPHILN